MTGCLEKVTDTLKFLLINSHGIVSARPLDHPARIIDLAKDEVLRKCKTGSLIICTTILLPAQEDVAIHLSDNARLKSPLRAHERQCNIFLCAFPHERRARSRVAKGCNLLKVMERKAGKFPIFTNDHNIAAVQRQIRLILIDKKCVQKRLHPSASLLSR